MTHPASIAQLTNDPSPFPGPYYLDLFSLLFYLLFYLLFLACIIIVLKFWPQKSTTAAAAAVAVSKPAQQPCQYAPESDSVYPPGMQIDMVLKEMDKEKGGRVGESVGGRGMAEGRRGVKCVIKV